MADDTDTDDIGTPIEERIGRVLRERGETLATAESCTGGLIGSLITDVPGASDYYDRTFVTYSYEAKMDSLGVSREALDDHGAVSEPVAREMASGIRDRARTDWGVATTGIAGPDGGTDAKPVGTVFIGVAHRGEWGAGDTWTAVERYELSGTRTEIKGKIARQALYDLLEAVENA
ncbi:CinA family protein [Natronomonas sp. EA1]|uniref:CinA family protein n=1 Tax=Natronomonas sp. EA1 TaxID=3421655 RepID=UPI003EBC0B47